MAALLQGLSLSPREREVAELYRRGYSVKYVARRFGISPRTVEEHVRHLYEKLGIHSRDELIEQHGPQHGELDSTL